jgi:hypothetical protein
LIGESCKKSPEKSFRKVEKEDFRGEEMLLSKSA